MKLSLRSAWLLLARLQGRLQELHSALDRWAPQPAPALVPIPIRAERHPHRLIGRRPDRGR
jgi:hypothetical protein